MKSIIQEELCTSMFIAALFTIAKSQKQPKCPSMEEWIKKMWYIYIYTHIHIHTYNGILLSHKKDKIMPFVTTWMDIEGVMLSKISQTKKNTILFHSWGR
uniref:DUF1725 domain-containing protein n=1 Tax=Equus caballus TaxID=9796 RepID=A0A9L0TDP3_HORSE